MTISSTLGGGPLESPSGSWPCPAPALFPAAPAARHASLTGNVGRKIVRGIDRQNSLQLQNQTPHPSINALPPSTGFRIPTSIDRNEWIM